MIFEEKKYFFFRIYIVLGGNFSVEWNSFMFRSEMFIMAVKTKYLFTAPSSIHFPTINKNYKIIFTIFKLKDVYIAWCVPKEISV